MQMMNTPSKPFSQPALHSQPAPGRAPTRAVCPPSAKPSQVQCSFFMQGRCTRGSSCKFSHDATDLQKKPRRSRGARPNDKIAERTSSSRRGKNPQHGPEKRWGALVRMYSRDGSGLMTPTEFDMLVRDLQRHYNGSEFSPEVAQSIASYLPAGATVRPADLCAAAKKGAFKFKEADLSETVEAALRYAVEKHPEEGDFHSQQPYQHELSPSLKGLRYQARRGGSLVLIGTRPHSKHLTLPFALRCMNDRCGPTSRTRAGRIHTRPRNKTRGILKLDWCFSSRPHAAAPSPSS